MEVEDAILDPTSEIHIKEEEEDPTDTVENPCCKFTAIFVKTEEDYCDRDDDKSSIPLYQSSSAPVSPCNIDQVIHCYYHYCILRTYYHCHTTCALTVQLS